MLEDDIKKTIQKAYSDLLQSRDLKPRGGQKQMIAHIANTLSSPAAEEEGGPICVVEAGTGTGKTLAYLLATIAVAEAQELKLVVATATVALQEQVILKDIPELLQGTALEFTYALAKGRGRYICLAQLENRLQPNDSLQAMLDLYDEELEQTSEQQTGLYQEMQAAIRSGRWRGDRDEWESPLSDAQWQPVTVDNAQCLGSRCRFFSECCVFAAREELGKVDVIVSNHDLVLSDLALGGGVILPAPEDSIYIFDEAHHLPIKSNNHFSNFAQLKSTMSWLDRVLNFYGQLLKEAFVDGQEQEGANAVVAQCRAGLEELLVQAREIIEQQPDRDSYGQLSQVPFKLGKAPEPMQASADNLAAAFQQLSSHLQRATDELGECAEQEIDVERKNLAAHWYPAAGSLRKRSEGMVALCENFAAEDNEGQAPIARWLTLGDHENETEIGLAVSPVLAADNLQENLWSRCGGAVLTSATLSALGRFDVLAMRAGLPERTQYLSIPSPFDFANAGVLSIPKLNCEPRDNERHTQAIVNALPKILDSPIAALMLFSSRRQMRDVLQDLSSDLADRVLCQDDFQKAELIRVHKQRIDDGEDSLIFGLASFAEGVDLPGKYCTHVLIAKIPFAVPNDPVEMTLSDWVEEQGKNPFITLSVPDAAFRLVQASGRLLRSETDVGRITLFDPRIVSKYYGKQILESLPPYRREVFTEVF